MSPQTVSETPPQVPLAALLFPALFPSEDSDKRPIASLPMELLQEIFAFSASPFPDPNPIVIPPLKPRLEGFNTTSLAISQVCWYWRSIAFCTREMWAHMEIRRSPNQLCLDMVKHYLALSRGAELYLYFRDPQPVWVEGSNPLSMDPLTEEIFNRWISELPRWRTIDFSVGSPVMAVLANLSMGPNDLKPSKITTASIHADCGENLTRFWEKLWGLHTLREVSMGAIMIQPPSNEDINLQHLTSISTMVGNDGLAWTKFLALLSSCTGLKRIEATVQPPEELELEATRTIKAPFLEILRLPCTVMNFESSCLLLDFIDAPSLWELEVNVLHNDATTLRRFLCRSGCILRRLKLTGGSYVETEQHFVNYLTEAAPHLLSLEVLHLYFGGFTSTTISAFSAQSESVDGLQVVSVLFPSLIVLSLEIIDYHRTRTPDGIIEKMLQSRHDHGVLPWVFEAGLYYGRKLRKSDREVVSKLKKTGKYVIFVG